MSHDPLTSIAPENPSAFPTFEEHERFDEERGKYVDYVLPSGGMLLRDYFAAKAMQAYVEGSIARGLQWSPIGIAKEAYLLADAMRVERAK